MSNYKKLIFEKNGKLARYDYDVKKGYVVNIDGDVLFQYDCFIECGVILRDIFLWMKKSIKNDEYLYKKLFGKYVIELINEGLKENNEKDDVIYDDLVVSPSYQEATINQDRSLIIGYENLTWQFYGEKNDEQYAIEFSEPSKLAKYEIIINNRERFYFYEEDKIKLLEKDELVILKPLNLYNFLFAIVYELTFFGSQKNRRKELECLNKACRECDRKDFKGISVSMEEILKKLNNKEK